MVRIFRHYVCARLATLVCLESAVLILAVYFGNLIHYQPVGEAIRNSIFFGAQASFPVAMILFATSMGLYDGDGVTKLHSAQIRLLGAGFLAGLIALVLSSYAPSLALGPE